MINDILNKYLNNEKNSEIKNYTLDGITALLEHMGNPQKNFKSIHIAGTNGKGSTAFILSTVLQKSGYRTGLYTSPHLIKLNERIKINALDIEDEILFKYLTDIDKIIINNNSISPTYFDILTAAAFAYFSDRSVDIAIIETGLGGRLDSTNTILPEISIITDISMDHISILGNTISDIAKEKCGIIKPNVPVITSNDNPGTITIIQDHTDKNKSELYAYNRDFFTQNIRRDNDSFIFDYLSESNTLSDIRISLFPAHQVKNSSVAINALLYLKSNCFSDISLDIIYNELNKIKVPGRFQILCSNPMIVYDPAHNFDSLNNLINGLNTFYPDKNKLFIISIMSDKADNRTLELFENSDVIYYLLDDKRAFVPEKNRFDSVISENNIIDILEKINKSDNMIIFTGTFRIYNVAVNFVENIKNSQDKS